MEWVFLAVSVNGAAYTLNAYVPVKRNLLFFGWSFFASWLTIELAWLHLLVQMVGTAFFVRKGVLRTRAGNLGLLINIASWIGLAVIVRRSFEARRQVHDAFKEVHLAETTRRRLGAKRTRNITYATVGSKALKLDVTEPAKPTPAGQRRPAIVQIHGGGWVIGDKREQGLPLLKLLADEGWVGFNVNYRLSPKATFPDHLIDVKRAIAWIREHADEYNIDPNFIVVTGGSAGGHLTAMVGLTGNDPRFQPGFEDADTSVQAAVPFYGVYDFMNRNGYYPDNIVEQFFGRIVVKADIEKEPEKFSLASPLDQVRADAPPFFVIHGDLDTLAPVEGARDFVEALRGVSDAAVVYLELKGAQHAFEIFPSIRANEVIRSVDRFLETLHDEYLAGVDPTDVPAEELGEVVDEQVAEDVSA